MTGITMQTNRASRVGVLLKACATAVALAAGLAFAFRGVHAATSDLSGTYESDDGAIYYVQQSGSTLWWAGMSMDTELPWDSQWHRGLNFTTIFRGTIGGDNTITGDWSDVTRGGRLKNGTLTLQIGSSLGGAIQLTRVAQTGGVTATTWVQTDALDDTKVNGTTRDIFSRFDAVRKNDDTTLLNPNLKPYRDATVFYARVVNSHLDYLNDNSVESEIPHVNYGPEFSPKIPSFRNFADRDREFHSFVENNDDGDGDFDVRLKVDLNKLEPNFYDLGWENHLQAPDILRWKLTNAALQQKLGYLTSEGYSGAETIMFGRPPDCSGVTIIPFFSVIAQCTAVHSDGAAALLPGWADLLSNSVLINGRSINGLFEGRNCGDTLTWTQPCPYLAGETPDQLSKNYLVAAAGIRLKNLLESGFGSGVINADDTTDEGLGTYLRVTGALILDCGHGLTHDCFDDPSDQGDVSGHSNQEIHPVYSIDVINKPFRPEDSGVSARPNLTGAWGGSDGSTYYLRQIGNTVWMLGLLRDRQPNQQSTSYDLIGTPQIAEATLLVGSPSCQGVRCWMFGTVFKGTIEQNADGTATLSGDWAGVPQSASPGSTGGQVTFTVDPYHKVMNPTVLQGLFPVTLEKMYEPEDTTSPVSALTLGTPEFPVPSTSSPEFVTSATAFAVTATDSDSDVQTISYRFFPCSVLPCAASVGYTVVNGSSATFNLSGADGLYEVDTYATDPAGNDETAHARLVYLDNTAPVATVTAPTATQYTHSDTFTIQYAVSDGAGCGVKSQTPDIDGLHTLKDGTPVANNQTVNLLTALDVGSHTFNVHSSDNLDNQGLQSVTFSIIVTADSIKADINEFVASGAIDANLAKSLLAKLDAAAQARARGDCTNAANIYRAFVRDLQAQSGKGVTAQAAAIMIADAQYLIEHCP
jgi:FIMAH domain-containing protein